jgi:uncharacterized protein (TIGR01777 family)
MMDAISSKKKVRMATFEKRTRIPASVQELFSWHGRPFAFERLAPPWEKMRVVERQGGIKDGDKVVLEMRQGPFRHRWVAVHCDYIEGQQFRDEQVEGPFAKWIHTHQFFPDGDNASTLSDKIEYQPPLGFLGKAAAGRYISRKLERTFTFRHQRTLKDLERLQPYAGKKPLKIIISGASGMIGTALTVFLSCGGHDVRSLVRRPPPAGNSGILWDPARRQLDKNLLEGADVVIHLAGESIASGRWTPRRKETILKSRVEGTDFLSEILASLQHPPQVFLCSSAIGFYGNRGDEFLNEESGPGQGFLTDVCKAWEAATEPAQKAGIRVVNVRTGIVLTALGGALAKMLTPFQMGAGGIIGSGRQWMSWVSLEDLIGIYHYLIYADSLSGPVNATAPEPVTNRIFTRTLGRVLKRPALFPLPSFAVKGIFGEMGEALLLEGQRVKPKKLLQSGFGFLYPGLDSSLRWELGK